MDLSTLINRARRAGFKDETVTAAARGDADAQFNLGSRYANDEGDKKDPVEAVAFFRKAAAQGHIGALCKLGRHYQNGVGVERSRFQAMGCYREAAELGDSDAQYDLGLLYEEFQRNPIEGVAWYRKSAEQGNAWAQYKLGICCRDGVGINQNYEDAFRWFLKASLHFTGAMKNRCNKARSDLESNHLTQSSVLSLQRELSGSSSQSSKPIRTSISRDVQSFVWNRDGGRCVECGSNENLEFDHIIPVSKGGSNTARNLQLLCEPCNRRKGASI